MSFEIVDSSPQAKAIQPKTTEQVSYPFDSLEIGKSFVCDLDKCNWKSLRASVYKKNSQDRTGKQFAFVKHLELNKCEVSRIA